MKIRFNHKGKWREPTIHLTGVPRDFLSTILSDAKKQMEQELEEQTTGGTADYNRKCLEIIRKLEHFLADTWPGKEEEIGA